VQATVQRFLDMRRENVAVMIKSAMPICSDEEVEAIVTHDDGAHVHKLIHAVNNVRPCRACCFWITLLCSLEDFCRYSSTPLMYFACLTSQWCLYGDAMCDACFMLHGAWLMLDNAGSL
jgi:hypothetical protein